MQSRHDFGGLVRELRIAAGWTQEQLAREAGLTVTSISNLERGATKDPNYETVDKLAAAFGMEPGDLDPRRLAEAVAESARSLQRRQVIGRLLALPDRDMDAILDFLDRRAKTSPRRRTK